MGALGWLPFLDFAGSPMPEEVVEADVIVVAPAQEPYISAAGLYVLPARGEGSQS